MAAPYVVVQQVFDNAAQTATSLQASSAAQIASISGLLSGLHLPSQISVPAITIPGAGGVSVAAIPAPSYSVPATSLITDTFAADYTAKLADAQAAVTAGLTTFFNTYFPMTLNDTELTLAQGWVINVLSNGGAMNPTIENQYWQRDRDRIARETAVTIDAASKNWAARGFALPPGALVGAALQAQRTGLEQISQSSRDVAIKKYETEVLLQQKAIELAISLRQTAMTAMVDFIKTLVFTPRDESANYAQISSTATKAANDALVSYFGATTRANIDFIGEQTRIGVANASNTIEAGKVTVDASIRTGDLSLRAALGTTDIAVRQNETAGSWGLQIAGKQVDVAVAGAHMAATMASAALNGIHATAAVSGSDTQNLQLYG